MEQLWGAAALGAAALILGLITIRRATKRTRVPAGLMTVGGVLMIVGGVGVIVSILLGR